MKTDRSTFVEHTHAHSWQSAFLILVPRNKSVGSTVGSMLKPFAASAQLSFLLPTSAQQFKKPFKWALTAVYNVKNLI